MKARSGWTPEGALGAAVAPKKSHSPVQTHYRTRIIITDLVTIAIAMGVAIAFGWGAADQPWPLDRSRFILALTMTIGWILALWLQQTRSTKVLGAGAEEYRRVLSASGFMVLFVATFAYFTDTTRARGFVAGVAILGTLLILFARWLQRGVLQRALIAGAPIHRVFVVAPVSKSRHVVEELEKTGNRYSAVGQWTSFADHPDPRRIVREALARDADTIVYVPFADADVQWTQRLGWAMENSGLSLLISPTVMEVAGPRLRMEDIQGLAFVEVALPKFSGPARVIKRAFDIAVSSAALLVLAIPMAIIAVAIKLDSRGPVLFRQERMGRGGETFICLKYRTMHVDADQMLESLRADSGQDGATFKLKRDPRVTRVGHFLRRSSLDELPQFWNVLRGEMSLVGPRPHQLADVDRYDDIATRRLLAKPGITGLWQVSGRSDTTWEENVRLDLYYVENWSLSMDIIILMRTVKVVLTGSGAY
jgi:exopolysaccharide biosynthesis polyprenyl glycosylphosphotransferase